MIEATPAVPGHPHSPLFHCSIEMMKRCRIHDKEAENKSDEGQEERLRD